MKYSTELVLGAACAAQRINGAYVKSVKWPDPPSEKVSNKSVMALLLDMDSRKPGDPEITEEDMELGRKVRSFFQALTLKVLCGEVLSDFDANALAICQREELSTKYELAVACSFPSCYERGQVRVSAQQKVVFAEGGYVGKIGDKVKLNIEVLRSFYSQNWNTYYVTAMSDTDQALFFAIKEPPAVGAKVSITGTVKSHQDNQTQLSRTKVV